MNESIVLFLQKVEKDEALAAKLSAIRSPDEAYALAASVQEGFTMEEFVAAMEQIRNGELSADELARMSGGSVDDTLISTSISVSASLYPYSVTMVASAAAI